MSDRAFLAMLFIMTTLACTACTPPKHDLVLSKKSTVELRAIQSKAFEGTDTRTLFHATVGALFDLGYSIDSIDAASGTITASKGAAALKLTVVVEKGYDGSVLRCDASVDLGITSQQVDSPEFYEKDIFQPVAQSLRLNTSHV